MVSNISVSAEKKDLQHAIELEVAKYEGSKSPYLDKIWATVAPFIDSFSDTTTVQVSFLASDENVNTSVRQSINLSVNVI